MAEQRYRVVDRLEAGGMAEVFRGEAAGVQGFRKEVAIKRVLPHLAQNRNFIAMFLDEARLGARLSHANIVAVNDIGSANDTYFIVMEFVDGANLKHVVEHFRKQKRSFPLKEAVFIAAEVCRGLSYAHELRDPEGQPLNIVHRDVSPPNVLLSRTGEVKVTDFGLAKAKTQLEKTDPGVVKGKFSYLSPEAAMGLAVDARADLFALGIVLWEMLAGRRLFLGENDYQTVKLVGQANVPDLTRLHPDVDDELAGLVRRMLAKDRAERFQSARELGDALAGYLFSHQLKVTSYDIAHLVKGTLEERAKEQPAPQQSIIDRLIREEMLRFTSLDDKSQSEGQTPLSPESLRRSDPDDSGASEGGAPLDPGEFENPSQWFEDDEEVSLGVSQATTGARPTWQEHGVEVELDEGDLDEGSLDPAALRPPADALEDRPTRPQEAAPRPADTTRRLTERERAAAADAPGGPPPLPPSAPEGAATATPAPSGVPRWLFGVLILVLVAAGAGAAWVLTGG